MRAPETIVLTLLALVAFAANSLLNRMALAGHLIDATSYTAIRLGSGAAMLGLLVRARAGDWRPLRAPGIVGPLALFGYAVPFSFAYLRIGAAAGALVLFGCVQLTMIGWGLARGERPSLRVWAGLALAAGGLAWLVLPAATRPDPIGTALMVTAGVAWGVYSLVGKRASDPLTPLAPLAANARSFLWATPLVLFVGATQAGALHLSVRGAELGVLSGTVTSGLGYAIWYRALRGLTAMQAGIVQLSVPVIAAVGGVVLLHEQISPRLLLSGTAVLGGVALVLSGRSR